MITLYDCFVSVLSLSGPSSFPTALPVPPPLSRRDSDQAHPWLPTMASKAFTRQLPACPSGLISHTPPIFSAIFRGDSGCNSSSVGRKEDRLNHLPLILLSQASPQPTFPRSLLSVQEALGRGRWLTSQLSPTAPPPLSQLFLIPLGLPSGPQAL